MNPKKKPPKRVVSIGGQHSPDVITQAELSHIGDLQAMEWMASQSTQKAVLHIDERIKVGAEIEPGELAFDRTLRMVRRKHAAPPANLTAEQRLQIYEEEKLRIEMRQRKEGSG